MLLAKGADGKSSPRLEFKKGDAISAAFELYGLNPTAAEMIVGFEYSPVGGTGARNRSGRADRHRRTNRTS
jgi:hypothetical protein